MKVSKMKSRVRSRWISKRETDFYCIDFSAFGNDRNALKVELDASEAVIASQAENSLLVTVDLHLTEMVPEIIEFMRYNSNRPGNPIRKMAILGVSPAKKIWYQLRHHVQWHRNSAFFSDFEAAKDWLISEKL